MKEQVFDVIVLGSGTAGQVVSYECLEKKLSVVVVDNRPFGGTCTLRGCDPKKVLVGAGEAVDWIQRMEDFGVSSKDVRINWKRLMEVKKSFVEHVPERVEKGLQDAGAKTFHGTATIIDDKNVSVNGQVISGKHLVIATGASPMKLGISGEEHVTISDDFLELTTLPKKIVFLGGGYISFEFAHLTARAGADVIILQRSEHLLSGFDPDLVGILVKASKALGIAIRTNAPVVGIDKKDSSLFVHTKGTDGKEETVSADLVVHGGGRVPNVFDLRLEKANVQYTKKGVVVNDYLQSVSNPHVFAAGDASEYGLPLTPVAGKEGLVVAHNILHREKKKAKYSEMPSVVFTVPPLASVGMREDEAEKKGLDFDIKFLDTSGWFSSRRIHEKHSGVKTLVEKKTGRILGAHLLGHNAEELINIFALAIAKNIPAEDLRNIIYSYPTHSSDIQYMV